MQKDHLQRFIFDNADVRGALVSLEQSYLEMLDTQQYGTAEKQLLGEFAAATVLLVGHLKFVGSLSLQARGGAGVDLLVAECNDALEYRGILRSDKAFQAYDFPQWFADGTLAITISPAKGQQYQGIVPLQASTLASCLADYFNQSEQLPTWFCFAVSGQRVSGMMLQAMPAQICTDEDETGEHWNRLVHLASTLRPEEMTGLGHEDILYRLYHEEQVRIFSPEAVRYQCTCSTERMERGLLTLGGQELLQLLDEQPDVRTQCHFCGREYVFSRADILALIQGAGAQNSH